MRVRQLEARRSASQDATRPSDRVAIGSVFIGGLLAAIVIIVRVGFSSAPAPSLNQLFSDSNAQAPHVQSGFVAEPTPAPRTEP